MLFTTAQFVLLFLPVTLLGFFLAGVVPELREGDVLRLQYLHDVSVDPSVIKIYSDFGRELLDYVMAARPSV